MKKASRLRNRQRAAGRMGRRVLSRRRTQRRKVTADLSSLKEPKTMSGVKFNSYIKKVLKKVKPRLGIDRASMKIMDHLVKDTLHQIAVLAAVKMGRRKVLLPKVIIRGMKQLLPKVLRDKANEQGQRALDRYFQSKKRNRK